MKRIIVTGATGFIGSHLVDRLIAEDYRVIAVDNLSNSSLENLNSEADFIEGDVSKPGFIKKLPHKETAALFHLAAQSSGEISFEDPLSDQQSNLTSTLLLLNWCQHNNIKRFFFTSSMTVVGEESESPLSEELPCNPKSFYGVNKLASENYITLYGKTGLETTIFRLFNVYGPGQNLANLKQGMVSIYMSYLLKGEPILVKGSLDRFRDQAYVKDVVDAFMVCMKNPVSMGKVYNIATGCKVTVRELINTMLKISGNSEDQYPVKILEGTKGDLFGCFADISRAKRELGWSCRYDLVSGLTEMYQYYSDGGS